MSMSVEYEETTAGREHASLATSLAESAPGAAQARATLAVYEVLAEIASELTYMRKLSQERQR